jgi:hypothetical protein
MAKRTRINGAKYRATPQRLVEQILDRREITADGCWLWPGRTTHDGYGYVSYKVRGKRFHVYVHRLIYTRLVTDPGDTTELDHLCHDPEVCTVPRDECPHRRCCNPDHLEPVTGAENVRRSGSLAAANSRKTHCPRNHPYNEANTRIDRVTGGRHCRVCRREDAAAMRAAENANERDARNAATQVRRLAVKLTEGRTCDLCGVSIAHRTRRAIYCERCVPVRAAMIRKPQSAA